MTRARNHETVLCDAIRDVLAYEPGLLLWRLNSGVFGARHVRAGLGTGCADLVGVLRPEGRFVALEVKLPAASSKPTAEQLAWLASVRAVGGFAAVVRGVEEARAAIGRARRGQAE